MCLGNQTVPVLRPEPVGSDAVRGIQRGPEAMQGAASHLNRMGTGFDLGHTGARFVTAGKERFGRGRCVVKNIVNGNQIQ